MSELMGCWEFGEGEWIRSVDIVDGGGGGKGARIGREGGGADFFVGLALDRPMIDIEYVGRSI